MTNTRPDGWYWVRCLGRDWMIAWSQDSKRFFSRDVCSKVVVGVEMIGPRIPTPDELTALQAKIDAIEPGTPEAIVQGVFDLAERECGHNPVSARHGLTTIEEWIASAKAQLAQMRAALEEINRAQPKWPHRGGDETWERFANRLRLYAAQALATPPSDVHPERGPESVPE